MYIKCVALQWALSTPHIIHAARLNGGSSHLESNCELQRFSFQILTLKILEIVGKILFHMKNHTGPLNHVNY